MEKEEIQKLVDGLNAKAAENAERLEKAATKEEAEAIKEELKNSISEEVSKIEAILKEQGEAMAKFKKASEENAKGKMTLTQRIVKSLDDNKEKVDQLLKDKKGEVEFEIKATQSAADITDGSDFAMMMPGIGTIPTRRPFIKDLFRTQTVNTEYIKYMDQASVVRDAKNVAGCGVTTHTSKKTWEVFTIQITKVRDLVDVCIDMMDDYSFVEGEIRKLVDTDVRLKVDELLLTGTGVAPQPNSIESVSATFAAGAYATSVDTPSLADLIVVTGGLIADAGQNNQFNADTVLLNPADYITLLNLLKDADKNYLMYEQKLAGLRIVTNPLVGADEMYMFDSSKGTILQREGTMVSFGFENGDNFETETVTVKAVERFNFWVRSVDANAFIHVPSIATAITAITKA